MKMMQGIAIELKHLGALHVAARIAKHVLSEVKPPASLEDRMPEFMSDLEEATNILATVLEANTDDDDDDDDDDVTPASRLN